MTGIRRVSFVHFLPKSRRFVENIADSSKSEPFGAGLKLKFRNSPVELELGRAAAKRFEELKVLGAR